MPVDAILSNLAEQQLVTAIVQAVTAESVRLALVVSSEVAALARLAQSLNAASGWEVVTVGPALSTWLLAQEETVTPRRLRQGVQVCLASQDAPAICTDLDLLFEPALQLDPLALLHQASRLRQLAVCRPGTYAAGLLAYAVPAHAHYRIWSGVVAPEVHIFPQP